MPKYMAVHVVVLAGLVVAVTLLVFTSRALTFRLDKLEAVRHSEMPSKPVLGRPAPADWMTHRGEPMNLPAESPSPAPPKQAEKSAAATASHGESSELSPAQEEAVAKAVDRILKEKYGHLPKFGNPEDLEKTLAKELNLTESQKARIADILKRKREEFQALFEGGDPMAGSNMKKAMDIERRSEAAIKNELDSAQQAKYDQLKKDGKIPLGVRIQVEAEDGSQKEEFEVR